MTPEQDLENILQIEFIQLIQENEGVIHKVLGLYSDSAEEAKDLKQEILLQSWKAYPNFRKEAKFSTWLYKISLNVALNQIRKKKKNKHTDSLHNIDLGEETKNEDFEILFYLIKKLNEIDRMIMTLHLEGYANKEIAEISGITSNNVNVKIHRIKQSLSEQFKQMNHG